jgi:hypothetical protein
MPDPASPADSIERFAELIALEDDGYVPRTTILSAAGVLAPVWRQIERAWMERLAVGDDADLALRFAQTYALTRLSLSNGAGGPLAAPEGAPSDGPLPALGVDDTLRDPLPPGGRDLELDAAEPPAQHRADELPTTGTGEAPAGYPVELLRPPMDPVDTTVMCPLDAIPNQALPFVPPVAPSGKVLAYFDTQTGQRLPMPVLIDAPPSTGADA